MTSPAPQAHPPYTAVEVRARLEREVNAQRAIVAAGAGSGLTAKCAALAGAAHQFYSAAEPRWHVRG